VRADDHPTVHKTQGLISPGSFAFGARTLQIVFSGS
jgi:hypothetical protein